MSSGFRQIDLVNLELETNLSMLIERSGDEGLDCIRTVYTDVYTSKLDGTYRNIDKIKYSGANAIAAGLFNLAKYVGRFAGVKADSFGEREREEIDQSVIAGFIEVADYKGNQIVMPRNLRLTRKK